MVRGDLYFSGGWNGNDINYQDYRFRIDPVPWISNKGHWAFINRQFGKLKCCPYPVKRAYFAHKDFAKIKPLPKEDFYSDDYLRPINRNWKEYRKTQYK